MKRYLTVWPFNTDGKENINVILILLQPTPTEEIIQNPNNKEVTLHIVLYYPDLPSSSKLTTSYPASLWLRRNKFSFKKILRTFTVPICLPIITLFTVNFSHCILVCPQTHYIFLWQVNFLWVLEWYQYKNIQLPNVLALSHSRHWVIFC